ncbi:hypothetical protein [Consotaella aegiceratis]|uniref:hypothetical protein n=1 Tax=Consotaella aegiceratis TaxID=3097961 RepID=UPI002F42B9F3
MLDWINDNSGALNVAANLAMIVIWIGYLQLFLENFRRERRAEILINRSSSSLGLAARCLISNMSSDAIYVNSLIGSVETDHGTWTCPVTDLDEIDEKKSLPDLAETSRQGPLKVADVRDLGSFQSLIDHVVRCGRSEDGRRLTEIGQPRAFTIKVFAVYGSEDILVGAERSFDVCAGDKGHRLVPRTVGARQIRSRRERRELASLLEQDL